MPVDVLAASDFRVTNKRKLDKESNQSEIVQEKKGVLVIAMSTLTVSNT